MPSRLASLALRVIACTSGTPTAVCKLLTSAGAVKSGKRPAVVCTATTGSTAKFTSNSTSPGANRWQQRVLHCEAYVVDSYRSAAAPDAPASSHSVELHLNSAVAQLVSAATLSPAASDVVASNRAANASYCHSLYSSARH
eukprot:15844-Heterococcus_DN1.PRE.4